MNSETKSDYTQKMKKELMQLIDSLNLEEMPKNFIKSRWLDQLMWMESASKKNQSYYYILRLACIIGGVIIPALVSLDLTGTIDVFVKLITVFLSLIVASSAAVEEFFHFGERWRHYRRTAELLKGEGWSFFQRSGNYSNYENHTEAYPEFAGRVEEAFQKEMELFVRKVSKEKESKA
jgi:hypothetical protein